MNSPQFSLDFSYSLGAPCARAGFRQQIEDFVVAEDLGFVPSGSGEHLLLHICKRNENTRWIAGLLAKHYGVDDHSVGYCGLKDRRAETSRWFSVHLPKSADVPLPELPGCTILAHGRHPKKLRPGMHRANDFAIVLRFDDGVAEIVEPKLAAIARQGVPNYFGEQRFGIEGNNLREVAAIVARPRPRFQGRRGGLYLSAARSWLFNLVLAARVQDGTWLQVADGPLWGRGRSVASADIALAEAEILAPWQDWQTVLEHSGLSQERRALVLMPENFAWTWCGNDLHLSFRLPPGAYATAILRELAVLVVPEMEQVEG